MSHRSIGGASNQSARRRQEQREKESTFKREKEKTVKKQETEKDPKTAVYMPKFNTRIRSQITQNPLSKQLTTSVLATDASQHVKPKKEKNLSPGQSHGTKFLSSTMQRRKDFSEGKDQN